MDAVGRLQDAVKFFLGEFCRVFVAVMRVLRVELGECFAASGCEAPAVAGCRFGVSAVVEMFESGINEWVL
ncbi:hypothetical protein D2E70_25705 [Mycobacteroides abscessus]|nr:hypothetical protein D2E70_25705 [Mycobacteroides abscessus]